MWEDNNATATSTTALATDGSYGVNEAMYRVTDAQIGFVGMGTSASLTLEFVNANGTVTMELNYANASTATAAVNALNSKLSAYGIYAVRDASSSGTGQISLQSKLDFSARGLGFSTGGFASNTTGFFFGLSAAQTTTTNAPAATDASLDTTSSAKIAIAAVRNAVSNLGSVQGKIGTAQNKLQYAINLAQSQISSFAAAESRIRDSDVAAEAANLTKAQVLQQASLAAMAQANSAPQAVLSLLRG